MEKLLKKLQPFMKISKGATLTSKLSMEEENIYDLNSDNLPEAVGMVQLSPDGHLKMFGEFCEEEGEPAETMTKDDIQLLTEKFLHEIFPKAVSNLHLDAGIDLDYFYVFEYVQKDVQFNLPMPNSGISFYMFKNGSIMDMTYDMDGITIVYPDDILAAELAREIYLENINPELKIMRYDDETYSNGDNSFVLVYDFFQNIGIDVKMDSTKTTLEDLGAENVQYLTIPEVVVDPVSIYSFINLEGMQKILVDGAIEVWSTHQHEDFDNEDLTDMDIGTADAVKIIKDLERGKLKQLTALSDEENPNLWSAEAANDKAHHILFSQFPDAHHSFKQREYDPAINDFDDEGEELPPYAYQFTFDRFENGIQVAEENIAITVSANNLELIEYLATDGAFDDFSNLVDSTPSNHKEAMELYEHSFEMKLHWAKDYEDDMKTSQYELVYLPVFKASGGHVHFISANTLELWVVDVGD